MGLLMIMAVSVLYDLQLVQDKTSRAHTFVHL